MASGQLGLRAPKPKPELLAPAGGPAAFAAALSSGADAIYLGLKRLSARALAENFGIGELKGAISLAKERGVKVYPALNSLVKEGELKDAFLLARDVASLTPDGIIVQDLGLAALLRDNFDIPLHASTLVAAHNMDGLRALSSIGFQRAVLPRELNVMEALELAGNSPIGTELFIHGALCFSFSGLCLFSSFFGGRSALRGACAQPCRRLYSNAGKKGAFFSLPDLRGAPLIKALREGGFAALKIEGRMKGPDYVARTVKAYRLLLDCGPGDFEEAMIDAVKLLDEAPERGQGLFFLDPRQERTPTDSSDTVSGLRLGFFRKDEGNPGGWGTVRLERDLALGDRLRLTFGKGEEGLTAKVKELWDGPQKGERLELAPKGSSPYIRLGGGGEGAMASGQLHKTGSLAEEKSFLNSPECRAIKAQGESYRGLAAPKRLPLALRHPPKAGAVFGKPSRGPLSQGRGQGRGQGHSSGKADKRLWLMLDDFGHLKGLLPLRPHRLIVPLAQDLAFEAARLAKRVTGLPGIVFRVPPLLFDDEPPKARRLAEGLIKKGWREFMVANLGALDMLKGISPKAIVHGDHGMGFLNHLAADELFAQGLASATMSLEADMETFSLLMKGSFPGRVLLYLSGRPPLFTAREFPRLGRGPVVSPRGERFQVARDGSAYLLFPEQRVMMAGFLRGPQSPSLGGFIADLRREPNAVSIARSLRRALSEGARLHGPQFNFRRGLK
ncbi:MAG: U32 family peptidase [Deltaproteobacteria bacterium]|nr:U32 family peptidase [Deltaproteobacteria bacterium]